MRASNFASASTAAGLALLIAAPAAQAQQSPVQIEGVSGDMREAIEDLLPEREAPRSEFDAERLADEAAIAAQAWLRAEGYYAGEARPAPDRNPPRARIVITPGERFRLTAPQAAYVGTIPDAQTQARVEAALQRARAGGPARAEDVLAAEAAAVAVLRAAGYPDAEAGARRVEVDHATRLMTPAFRFTAGAQTRLGAVRVEPETLLRAEIPQRLAGWDEGDLYDPALLDQLRRDLSRTGAFSRVNTTLAPRADEPGVSDVVIELSPAPRTVSEYGVGYSTTEGFGLDAQWTRRNFSRRADTLRLAATLGGLRQDFTAELSRPHAAGRGRTARYAVNAVHEDTSAFERTGVSIGAEVEAERRLRFGASYGVDLSADEFANASGVDYALALAGFLAVRNDTTGNPLDAREGTILEARIEPTFSSGDASVGFLRAFGEARYFRSFGNDDTTTLALRARLGAIAAFAGDAEDIQPDRRLYAGGGGSVRGYEFNSIFPEERRAEGATPGGEALIELGAEIRQRFGERFGAVAFIDGGNAFDEWEDAGDLRWGAGLGVRYDLGFAPLRVDVAVPIDPRPIDPDYALYVSLGQAF